MIEEELKKLDYYLNICFKYLEKKDGFLISNLDLIDILCEDIKASLNEFDDNNSTLQNDLTYQDVFLCAREIIETINPKYLEDFDKLIASGELDFSYNNEYFDSMFYYDSEHKRKAININREFNYSDVTTLIHEYFHYTNGKNGENAENRYLLTEFISIYFEIYATKYLIGKGINKEEIDYKFRFRNLKYHIDSFQRYSLVLLAFARFGYIDSNSCDMLNQYYLEIDSNEFFGDCKDLLNYFEESDKNYQMDKLYEDETDEAYLAYSLIGKMKNNYRYILGIVLAFYANYNCDINDITYLNDNINGKLSNINTVELLRRIGMDLNDEALVPAAIESAKQFLTEKIIQR